MSLDTAIEYLRKIDTSKLENIIVIHLSKSNAKKGYFKEKIQKEVGTIVKIAADTEEF